MVISKICGDTSSKLSICQQYIQNYIKKEDGNLSIIGAFSLIPMLGVFALSIDLGIAYSKRMQNQSLADSIALSAALYYSGTEDESIMQKVAQEISLAAQLDPTSVTASIVPSPNNSANDAVKININSPTQTYFASILGDYDKLNIPVNSFVEIPKNEGANCIIALSGGVSLSTSARLNANCGIGAKTNVTATTSSVIDVSSINLGGTTSATSSGIIRTSPKTDIINANLSDPVADPFAGSAALENEFNKIGNAVMPILPAVPIGDNFIPPNSGNSYNFQGNNVSKSIVGVWSAPPGTYNIRNLNLSSSKRVVFESPSTITVSGDINVTTSSKLEIGSADILSRGRLMSETSGQIIIGDGRHYFRFIEAGSSSSIEIGHGHLDVEQTISVGSSGSITIGAGDKAIGQNIDVESSGVLSLGDGQLHVGGNVWLGSSAIFTNGETPETYINGNLTTSSSAILNFAPSRYYIGGDFGGSSSAIYRGTDVSFFTNGDLDISSSSGSYLSAPSNDGDATVDTLIFASRAAQNAKINSSGNLRLTGTYYTPNARLIMSSSGQLSGQGQCALIVANNITISSSAQMSTQCNNLSEAFSSPGAASKISLVQ